MPSPKRRRQSCACVLFWTNTITSYVLPLAAQAAAAVFVSSCVQGQGAALDGADCGVSAKISAYVAKVTVHRRRRQSIVVISKHKTMRETKATVQHLVCQQYDEVLLIATDRSYQRYVNRISKTC